MTAEENQASFSFHYEPAEGLHVHEIIAFLPYITDTYTAVKVAAGRWLHIQFQQIWQPRQEHNCTPPLVEPPFSAVGLPTAMQVILRNLE